MPKVYAYGRASTDKQQITLAAQEEVCRKWFALRQALEEDLELVGWFPDAAVTAKTPWFRRPMGERICNLAKPGDVLLVSNFDRAFRSVVDCCHTLDVINGRGLRLVVMDMDVDTRGILGQSFMKMMAIFKEMELHERSRCTKAAMHWKQAQGLPYTKAAPFGWKKVGYKKDSRFVPDPIERKIGKQIVMMRDHYGLSVREIAKRLTKTFHYRTTLGGTYNKDRVCHCYVAAKCGFPKLSRPHMPLMKDLVKYMEEHDGRPPALQSGAVQQGLLHTLPPISDPALTHLQQDVV